MKNGMESDAVAKASNLADKIDLSSLIEKVCAGLIFGNSICKLYADQA